MTGVVVAGNLEEANLGVEDQGEPPPPVYSWEEVGSDAACGGVRRPNAAEGCWPIETSYICVYDFSNIYRYGLLVFAVF